jgi:hypothetical protein
MLHFLYWKRELQVHAVFSIYTKLSLQLNYSAVLNRKGINVYSQHVKSQKLYLLQFGIPYPKRLGPTWFQILEYLSILYTFISLYSITNLGQGGLFWSQLSYRLVVSCRRPGRLPFG